MRHEFTGDDLTKLYHGTKNVRNVVFSGLIPAAGLSNVGMLGDNVQEAVFLTPDPLEAAEYGVVLQVDASKLSLDIVDGPECFHYFTTETIAPELLRRVPDINAANREYEASIL